jgi:hypothetical protein
MLRLLQTVSAAGAYEPQGLAMMILVIEAVTPLDPVAASCTP